MSYISFKNQWLGKRIDYDGVYGYQCVDLIKQWLKQEDGLNPGAWGDAIDYWTKTNSTLLTKYEKVQGSNGQQGDIVIFNGNAGNVYGHIGIVESVDGVNVLTLEQNGSAGNGSGTGNDAIRMRNIPRSRVAGLLRRKQPIPYPDKTDLQLAEMVWRGELGNGEERKKKLGSRYAAVQALVDQGIGKPVPKQPVISTNDIIHETPVPFTEVKQETNTLYVGEEKVVQEGRKGIKVTVTRVTYTDGKETSRVVTSEYYKETAMDRVILVGTKEVEIEPTPEEPTENTAPKVPDVQIPISDTENAKNQSETDSGKSQNAILKALSIVIQTLQNLLSKLRK